MTKCEYCGSHNSLDRHCRCKFCGATGKQSTFDVYQTLPRNMACTVVAPVGVLSGYCDFTGQAFVGAYLDQDGLRYVRTRTQRK